MRLFETVEKMVEMLLLSYHERLDLCDDGNKRGEIRGYNFPFRLLRGNPPRFVLTSEVEASKIHMACQEDLYDRVLPVSSCRRKSV